jgi:FKBP-type peptidyl-prolyl cis-trans isomerase FklB
MQQLPISNIVPGALLEGIRDALTGAEPKLTRQQCDAAISLFQDEMQKKAQLESEKNLREANAFLAANKKKPGVVVLPSGLQYQILKRGNGRSPKITDKVRTHYHGTLINGTVFDSSVERGEPIEFAVNGVIRGWTEALQLMKVGDKWRLVIPPNLAYGPNPRQGGPIGPNAALVFEVELLGIK